MTEGFSRSRVLPKIIVSLWLASIMLIMSACSLGGNTAQTKISISKDGRVSVSIVESFDKTYYDKDELQQQILTEVAGYNRAAGNGNVAVEKIEVEDGMATVVMTYAKAADYAAFNNSVFFVGSAKEAQEAGYELNTVLSGTKDENETIGMSDMFAMTDYQMLITDIGEPVELAGKAAYISNNVNISKNRKTVTLAENSQGPIYVIFR